MRSETSFTYSIYVEAVPEQVWRALTERACTRQFWRHSTMGGKTFPSDWKKGSTWDLVHEDVGLVVRDPVQVILEADPPHRLSYTWHSFTPEWAALAGLDEETAARVAGGASFESGVRAEERGLGVVRLTVTHDGFGPESRVLAAISEGWPAVFSSLKTLLETGSPLPST